jgi:hypothetical protein
MEPEALDTVAMISLLKNRFWCHWDIKRMLKDVDYIGGKTKRKIKYCCG